MISDIYIQDNVNQRECKRCGTCCKKGGPSLHGEDRSLVVQGVIGPSDLVTYRPGEVALNPLSRELVGLGTDMIKVRGVNKEKGCIFFDFRDNSCSIYETRPLECRQLKCWDTREVEKLFLANMLQRKDLIPDSAFLSDLIVAYEEAFPVSIIWQICKNSSHYKTGMNPELNELIEKDIKFRGKVCELAGIDIESCDFFFGRPVSVVYAVFEAVIFGIRPKNE